MPKLAFFDMNKYKNELSYFGTISGKDEDKIERSKLTVKESDGVKYIEEADMVFEMSEMNEVDSVFGRFLKPQIMTFSATIPNNLMNFLNKYLDKNEIIDLVGKDNSKESINHIFIPTKNKNKDDLLVALLNTFHPYLALIFANILLYQQEMLDLNKL